MANAGARVETGGTAASCSLQGLNVSLQKLDKKGRLRSSVHGSKVVVPWARENENNCEAS